MSMTQPSMAAPAASINSSDVDGDASNQLTC